MADLAGMIAAAKAEQTTFERLAIDARRLGYQSLVDTYCRSLIRLNGIIKTAVFSNAAVTLGQRKPAAPIITLLWREFVGGKREAERKHGFYKIVPHTDGRATLFYIASEATIKLTGYHGRSKRFASIELAERAAHEWEFEKES